MRPPPTAILFIEECEHGRTLPEEWGFILNDEAEGRSGMPWALHRPTGLVFGMAQHANHSRDCLKVYAIHLGQVETYGSVARLTRESDIQIIGRDAILMYLDAIKRWNRGGPSCR